jgi:hypothetical protein
MGLGKISNHDLPNAGRVDTVIGVGNDIPETTHLAPGKARIPLFDLFGEVRRGLSNDLQSPLDCIPKLTILPKVLQAVAFSETSGIGHRLVNVGEILFLTAGHETKAASREKRDPRNGSALSKARK